MNDFNLDKLIKDAHALAEDKIYQVAKDVQGELKIYARKHKKTGELSRNITMKKTTKNGSFSYIIDGGTRSNYKDKSYHPLTFFVHQEGKDALTQILKHARNKIK